MGAVRAPALKHSAGCTLHKGVPCTRAPGQGGRGEAATFVLPSMWPWYRAASTPRGVFSSSPKEPYTTGNPSPGFEVPLHHQVCYATLDFAPF